MKTWTATLATFLLAATPAAAQVTIDPGDLHTFSAADACSTALEIPNVLDALANSDASCDAAAKRVRAETRPIIGPAWVGLQTIKARASLRNDFTVGSDTETEGNTIGAWVTYDVNFEGLMVFVGFFSNPTVELAMTLTDLTENKKIAGEMIWSRDGEGIGLSIPHVPVDINFGGGIDAHGLTHTFATVLRRGHSYRLQLELVCSVFSDGGLDIGSECDYMDGFLGGDGGGAGWTRLEVKAGIDEAEVLDTLEQFKNHTHPYLTGAGVGHNNTPAVTGPPVEEGVEPAPAPLPFPFPGRRKGHGPPR